MNISAGSPKKITLYNPEGFDPTRYVQDRDADAARYLVHIIEARRVFDHSRSEDSYTYLKAAYLRNVLGFKGKAERVRDALISGQVIQSDGYYVKNHKSIGYRLHPGWRRPFRRHVLGSSQVAENVGKYAPEYQDQPMVPVHLYLRDWLHQIQIDYEGAISTLDPKSEDYIPKQLSVEKIKDRDFFFSFDAYGRVHTNLTSLSRHLRQYLSVQGQQLKTIDIRNSQPFFLNVVINNYNNNKGSIQSFHQEGQPNHTCLHYDETSTNEANKAIKLLNKLEQRRGEGEKGEKGNICLHYDETSTSDLEKYKELTSTGQFYNHLMDQMGVSQQERAAWKRDFFGGVFFSHNKTRSTYQELFSKEFPTVYRIITDLKRKDYRALAHYLQRAESAVMIHRVCRRLMEDHPSVPVLTIHDSISTTPDHVDTVTRIMREEFDALGLTPTFSVE